MTPTDPLSRLVFPAAIALGAFLLFMVQPLLGAQILPWFGGSPAVWTTAMLFFQTMLLVGYAYAHWLAGRGPWQGAVHLGLAVAALVLLPPLADPSFAPTEPGAPIAHILLLLLVTIGLPYLVLAGSSPLLQAWAGRVDPRSPYRLYAWSNAGSLLALVGYPFVVEPWLGGVGRARLWAGLYAVFTLFTAAVVWRWWRAGRPLASPYEEEDVPLRGGDVALWVALPAVASALLLAVTDAITQDVSVVPFLWVAPLALYLLTFIIVFAAPPSGRRRGLTVALVLALGGMLALMHDVRAPLITQVGVWCGGLFIGCLALHAELVRRQPARRHLTAFYLAMSLGGALGGAGVALVAPYVFSGRYELHLAVWATAALYAWSVRPAVSGVGRARLAWALGLLLLLGLGETLRRDVANELADMVDSRRSFFGVLRVQAHPKAQILFDGRISHGFQLRDAPQKPTAYFASNSGVGQVLSRGDGGRHVGLVGLGAGTLAAYGKPGDRFRFFEINPDVVDVARTHFTFLADSAADVEVVTGDARLALARELDRPRYDILVLDAFSGDAVPAHLLTLESMDIYLKRLKPKGILAFHVSNKHLDIARVVHRLAEELGLASTWSLSWSPSPFGMYVARWMIIARDPTTLDPFGHRAPPGLDDRGRAPLWTDDHTPLWPVLKG